MNFGFPQFFWALLALSIPLLIHLFNLRRPKTVFFSNTRFLKALEEQTKSIKKLRYWLILSLRSLALAALVLAFTLPYQESDAIASQKRQTTVHIYIDNSLSMQAEGPQGSLFNQARLYANNLLKSLPEEMQVQLITNDFLPRYQRFYGATEARELIRALNFSASFKSVPQIIKRFQSLGDDRENQNHHFILLSDFQAGLFDSDTIRRAENERIQLVQLQGKSSPQNIAIDSISFGTPVFAPGLDQELKVYIRNYGDQAHSGISLKFYLNDTLRSTQIVDLEAGSLKETSLDFSPNYAGAYKARLEIDKGAPAFDNSFYFSFQTLKQQGIYTLSESETVDLPLQIFQNDFFEYRQDHPENIDYDYLSESRLILIQSDLAFSESLQQKLGDHLEAGKNIWFFPQEEAAVYQAQLKSFGISILGEWQDDSLMAQVLKTTDPFLRKSFIPSRQKPLLPFSKYYLGGKDQAAVNLLGFSNAAPLISRKGVSNGQVFYSQSSLKANRSNLKSHPVLIPLLVNAAFYTGERPMSYIRSGNAQQYQTVDAPKEEMAIEIQTAQGAIIPFQRYRNDHYEISLNFQELAAGIYPLNRDQQQIAFLAINTDPRESNLSELEDLPNRFSPPAEVLDPQNTADTNQLQASIQNKAQALWPWFLALALFFLILEMLFLKSISIAHDKSKVSS